MMIALRRVTFALACALLAPGCVIHTTQYEDQPPQPPPRRRSHQPSHAPPPAPARQPPATRVTPPAPAPGRPPPQAVPSPAGRLASPPAPPIEAQPDRTVPAPTKGDPARMAEGVGTGRPPGFRPGAAAAYWIWQGPRGGWRLRTTTQGKPHVFRGRIKGVTGNLTNVHPSRTEFRDRVWRERDGSWTFSFRTSGHADGFTFMAQDNGCVAFDLQLDGGPDTKKIFVGRAETQPASSFFVVCPKGAQPNPRQKQLRRLPGGR